MPQRQQDIGCLALGFLVGGAPSWLTMLAALIRPMNDGEMLARELDLVSAPLSGK
jgi:hypothetical protein